MPKHSGLWKPIRWPTNRDRHFPAGFWRPKLFRTWKSRFFRVFCQTAVPGPRPNWHQHLSKKIDFFMPAVLDHFCGQCWGYVPEHSKFQSGFKKKWFRPPQKRLFSRVQKHVIFATLTQTVMCLRWDFPQNRKYFWKAPQLPFRSIQALFRLKSS